MWAKNPGAATSIVCAACIAAAAVLPTANITERAASDLATSAAVRLSVDWGSLAAFDAIPAYIALLGGDLTALNFLDSVNGIPALAELLNGNINTLFPDDTNPTSGYDALSAIDIFFGDGADGEGGVISDGNFDGLSNYDALSALPAYRTLLDPASSTQDRLDALASLDSVSAIPVFVEFANAAAAGDGQGAAAALGGYDALSALDTFFGDGPVGQDGNPIGGVFTGGGIDALAPGTDGSGGYAALSAVPVFVGTNPNAPFGVGVLTGGGINALANYDALSAIPAYLDDPTTTTLSLAAPLNAQQNIAQRNIAPEANIVEQPAPPATTPPAGSNRVQSFVASLPKPQFTPPAPRAFTPPAPPKVDLPKVDPTDNDGPALNVMRTSEKFTPKGIGDSPILFGSGTPGVDNGIRGWGDGLKKLGIGGGEQGGESQGGASQGGGTP